MARGNYQPVYWPEILGLNETRDPSNMLPNELVESLNDAGRDSANGTRPGFNFTPELNPDYTAAIAGTPGVQSMTEFSRDPNFLREFLLVIADGNVYKDSASAALDKATNSVQLTTGDDFRWTFATFQDKIFACGGDAVADVSPAADSFWYWDGTGAGSGVLTGTITLENLSGVLGTHRPPRYCLHKWGRVYVAGMDPVSADRDASYNRMCVRYHDIGQNPVTSSAIAWPPENTIGSGENVGDGGGLADYGDQFITGLGEYTDPSGDWLMIGTNRSMLSVTRTPDAGHFVDATLATGLVHQNAFVNLGVDGGDAVFMSDRGIHSVLQSRRFGAKEDTFLSWKIRDTFESLSRERLPFTTGAYDPREGYITFLVSRGGLLQDTILCLDTQGQESRTGRLDLTAETARWHIWEIAAGVSPNIVKVLRGPEGKPRLYMGTLGGEVGHMNRAAYADFDNGYPCRFQTAHTHLARPDVEKVWGDIWVDVQPGGNYQPTMQRIVNYGQDVLDAIPLDMPADVAGSLLDGVDLLDSTFLLKGADVETFALHEYERGRGTTGSLRFEHSGKDEPFFIANLSQEVGGLGDAGDTSTA